MTPSDSLRYERQIQELKHKLFLAEEKLRTYEDKIRQHLAKTEKEKNNGRAKN